MLSRDFLLASFASRLWQRGCEALSFFFDLQRRFFTELRVYWLLVCMRKTLLFAGRDRYLEEQCRNNKNTEEHPITQKQKSLNAVFGQNGFKRKNGRNVCLLCIACRHILNTSCSEMMSKVNLGHFENFQFFDIFGPYMRKIGPNTYVPCIELSKTD